MSKQKYLVIPVDVYIDSGDVVPVVRCKDCKHFYADDYDNVVVYRCELNHEDMRDDFYCADGER